MVAWLGASTCDTLPDITDSLSLDKPDKGLFVKLTDQKYLNDLSANFKEYLKAKMIVF